MAEGPLSGIRVVEFMGLGPGPFGCLLLADLGAEILTVARPGQQPRSMLRNRAVIEVDAKEPTAAEALHAVIDRADVVVEGFRPGVLERMGFAPVALRERNRGLIVARMTGWGQTGPYAARAGHDITYIAVTGALHVSARAGTAPVPPANLLGDFGAGGMYLVTAVLAALVERARTGEGQVLDVAIVDGANYLTSMLHEYRAHGRWSDEPGTNRLDTGAPYYDVYRTADGGYVAVGALEDKFFEELADLLGLSGADRQDRQDPRSWPRLRSRIADAIGSRTRDEWADLAAATDACLAPVLSLAEAAGNPHVAARGILHGDPEHGWEPRLPLGHAPAGAEAGQVLRRWGVAGDHRDRLLAAY
ncbi:CaiB/BaiF CoA-transferase family protein [Nonomuraea sp. NPDC005650]|uniref:CaiB/BaiF CoA transferase family protein n=1 Tax=Nonomuraea sp. NPDC005650 TaxID=3157045 RepID=UPI0033A2A2B9